MSDPYTPADLREALLDGEASLQSEAEYNEQSDYPNATAVKLARENAKLTRWLADNIEALMKDAGRYRELKDGVEFGTFGFVYEKGDELEHFADDGAEIDAIIDAARKP